MKARLFVLATVGITLFPLLSCSNRAIQCDAIAERAVALIKENEVDQLYASLAEGAKASTPRAEFDQRANVVITELRDADGALRFVKDREGGVNPDGFSDLYYEFRTVGNGANKLDVEITIDLKGQPKLFDVCVTPQLPAAGESLNCLTNALRKI